MDWYLSVLKKYAVFSKSKLTDESAAWVRFGLAHGDAALTSLGLALPAETDSVVRNEGLIAIRVSPERAELWLDGGHNPHAARAIARHLEQMGGRTALVTAMLASKDSVGFFMVKDDAPDRVLYANLGQDGTMIDLASIRLK